MFWAAVKLLQRSGAKVQIRQQIFLRKQALRPSFIYFWAKKLPKPNRNPKENKPKPIFKTQPKTSSWPNRNKTLAQTICFSSFLFFLFFFFFFSFFLLPPPSAVSFSFFFGQLRQLQLAAMATAGGGGPQNTPPHSIFRVDSIFGLSFNKNWP